MTDYPVDDATLMTFAGIAYGALSKIPRYLKEATQIPEDWSYHWWPAGGQNPDNLAYIALNKKAGQAVVAIRGTYPNPFSPIYWENGKQDSPFGTMQPWEGSSTAKISEGTHTGYTNLIALKNDAGLTLEAAIAALDPSVSVTVTGHSLGGTLTPVLALKLAQNEASRTVFSVSFAGMTPGNRAFAKLCGSTGPLAGKTRRVFNTIDSVSYGWNSVLATRKFFQPNPQGGWLVTLFLVFAWLRPKLGGYGYAAIGDSVPLKGSVKDPSKTGLVAFIVETLHQHMPDTYLSLLGAPPLPFSILFGNVTVDRDAVTRSPASTSKIPVFHV
ncbi:MAG: lipase [Pseudomonadota bacterium]